MVAIGLGAYGFTRSNNNKNVDQTNMEKIDDTMVEDNKMMEDDTIEEDDSMMEEDKMMAKGGEYLTYSPALLSRADDNGNVVLFFHASWCPTCKALDNSILNSDIPDDLTILKVDYDSSAELKKKYSVVIQHTLVQVDSQGNEISKWVGGNTLADVEDKLK